ncbi:MAG: hypothetical protein M0R47_13090 [Methylobacter sp.]|jgi:hypothetical protein|nr:hypothetical protein [Methylobacter sp.]MCK9621457.1 hypothetical protein [Methylobacter sp.]
MKIIRILILLVSFLAIAGAAFFQLFVLLANSLFFQQNYHRHFPRQG